MLKVTHIKLILLLFISAFGFVLSAQPITVSGSVTEKSGEPLLGVNVYLQGTYDGATTNLDGSFSFETHERDSLVLVASFVGFKDAVIPLTSDNYAQLKITLKEAISELNAVVITAGAFNASEDSKREVLKPLDIVTTAGATADVPGALNTLPGTQTVGETGRLFVRGGDGRETKTFIDGMLVHNEYSPSAPNTPGRSRFSPFMFKGMSFSTGGYSAEYGQALSSALVMQSKDVAQDNRTDVSLMSVGIDASTTRSFEKSSFAGKIQYTNLTPYFTLVNQRMKWDKAPVSYNGNFAYRANTSKTGKFKVYTNLSKSEMDLYESAIVDSSQFLPVHVNNDYAHVNLSYREFLGEKWGFRSGVSFTKNDDFASLGAKSQKQQTTAFHTKAVIDYEYSDHLSLLGGVEVLDRKVEQNLIGDKGIIDQGFHEPIGATFIEAEIFASTSVAFKTGGRLEYNDLTGKTILSPRLSMAGKTGENSQISLAYGSFRQAPVLQVVLTDVSAIHEKAEHYIANYQWKKEGKSFRAELYEKRYNQLTKYSNLFDSRTFTYDGKGYARGVDLFWRDSKTFKNTDYWVSYSFLRTERDYQNYPGSFTPPFASNHNFSMVVKKFFDPIKSQVGLTYSVASPRTYHDPNRDSFMSGKTPTYHDLSFNISYLHSNQVIIHAMVNNVLGFNNVFGYEFAENPDENGVYASRAITPPAKRFIFLGVFITLSKNKGINQLPSL